MRTEGRIRRGDSFSPRFTIASTCVHNPSIARIPICASGENKKKCPIKSSENCLNSAPNPVVGRGSHSAAQLSGHWRAGYALLPCCWRGEAEPIPKPHLRISPRKPQIRHLIYAIRAISAVTLEAQLALISIPSECMFQQHAVRQVLDLVFRRWTRALARPSC